MKIVIIGGVAGGATAAARLRRCDESAQIVLVERGPYISFANCGLPYHLSGAIASREQLLVTTAERFAARYRVDVRTATEAVAIDPQGHEVRLRDAAGRETTEHYDRLLLSPGAEALRPPLPGLDSPRVCTLRNIPDLDRIMQRLPQTQRAVVVGGGFIGLEVAENLHERGVRTTLVEAAPQVMAALDEEMAAIVHATLRQHGVGLRLGERLERVVDDGAEAIVHLSSGRRLRADLVVLAIGVRPEVALARGAGLALGERGGIRVDHFLRSSDADIYAVGDAIEVPQRISGQSALVPLAGPANRQARLAADNMLAVDDSRRRRYRGALGTAVLKVFELGVACTGLSEAQARAQGIACRSTITHGGSHASYYPGAQPLALKLVWDEAGRIVGAQAVGAAGADKRIDVIATAMHAGLDVWGLAELELAYAPPFGSAKDPVNVAGYVAANVLDGSSRIVDWRALRARLDAADPALQLVDVRSAEEYAIGSLPGARHIALDELRERLPELDPARPTVVFCQVGLRGYLALRILLQHGFADAANLSGGFKTYAWACGRQDDPDIFDYEAIKRRPQAEIDAELDRA
ncbi:coenzyme A disulfide reductase [mine drainage metagenome]|uniref:Coenzyme A disulfide reductase n=1 Tax=mine drainage metagenome TaxID=410659 RepID=A0A1J5QIQ1_9ZZZZ